MKRSLIAVAIATVLCGTLWAAEKACCATPDSAKTCAVKDSSAACCATKEAVKLFTLQELAAFDGKDGRKGYVACDGVVYDVTGVPSWKGGKHNGAKAGNDMTKLIMSSPHGKSVLKKLTVIGKLAPAAK